MFVRFRIIDEMGLYSAQNGILVIMLTYNNPLMKMMMMVTEM